MRSLRLFFLLLLLLSVACTQKGGDVSAPVPAGRAAVSVDLNRTLKNSDSSLDSLDMEFRTFMKRWNIRGISFSVMRNDSLLYSKGYGFADEPLGKEMTPGTILRVASVSKLITAIGIMVLVDRGELSLRDKVFGDGAPLEEFNACIRDDRYYRITVEDLLRHEGGFSTKGGDPMFSALKMREKYGFKEAPDADALVRKLVGERLEWAPGTRCEYSNLGYLLLSMVIERVTGCCYEDWMQENVLKPAGCVDMHLAHNYYEQRYPNETRYHMQSYDHMVKEYNGSGRDVQRCYGGNDIRLLSGAGAWVTSSAELARLMAAADALPVVGDVISEESVRDMVRWYDYDTYPLGWISSDICGGRSRTGTLAATNALVKYYPDGECWIMITNTNIFWGSKFSRYTTRLLNKCKEEFSSRLPERNMFFED